MKKTMILILVIAFAFGMFIVDSSEAKILNGFHDFSTNSDAWVLYNGSTDLLGSKTTQMCVFCHHPHRNAGASMFTNEILWNQSAPGETSYAVYDSSTINGTAAGDVSASSGMRSYLCLSCHDGLIADSALIAAPRDGSDITNAFVLDAYANLGTTLEDDHPVNIEVPLEGGLATPAEMTTAGFVLFGGEIQCATCHDVHDNGLNGSGGSTATSGLQFMRLNDWQANSKICTECHTNK